MSDKDSSSERCIDAVRSGEKVQYDVTVTLDELDVEVLEAVGNADQFVSSAIRMAVLTEEFEHLRNVSDVRVRRVLADPWPWMKEMRIDAEISQSAAEDLQRLVESGED